MKLTLRSLTRTTAALIAAFLLLSAPVSAQNTVNGAGALTYTTLSAAITDTSAQSLVVASATGITAPGTGATLTMLYIDRELIAVRTLSGTTVTVVRGQGGSQVSSHALGAVVMVGSPSIFSTVDPSGTCVTAQSGQQIVNIRSGNVSNCSATTTGFLWQAWNSVPVAETRPRTVITTQAYTILPTDYAVILSTTSGGVSTRSFTLPSHVGVAGKQLVILDESAGGISATTSIVLIGTINGTNSSITTVIQMKTAGMSVGLQAGSGGWFVLWCTGAGSGILSWGATSGCR